MKNITKFLGALALFMLAIAIAIVLNPYKEYDTANCNLEQTREEEIETNRHNIKLSEVYTVIDIRESVYSNGRLNIFIVLQDNNKNRTYYEYDNVNKIYDSEEILIKDITNINNNVRIIAPGDKVKYLGNDTFELIVEQ